MTTSELKKEMKAVTETELGSFAPSIKETVDQRLELLIDAYFLDLIRQIDVRKGERQ
jgi:hypothetical protein